MVWRLVSPGRRTACWTSKDLWDVLESPVAELKVMVARIDAQISYLATKADLADKPGNAYMWGILAALLTA